MTGGARLARWALAALALLVVLFVAVSIYVLTSAELGAAQLELALVIQGALLLAAIALFWTWLETRILRPLQVLEGDLELAVHGNAPRGAHLPDRKSVV